MLDLPYYHFGSEDSLDTDVLVSVDRIGTKEEAYARVAALRALCPDGWNINLIVVREGHIAETITSNATADGLNNSLWTTYALHEAKQARKLADAKAQREVVLPSVEIDLRGLAVDEALARIDAFLDVHYSGPTGRVRIIHGHGSGALKQAVRDHLKRSGYVKSHRPGDEKEGGDGATVVELA